VWELLLWSAVFQTENNSNYFGFTRQIKLHAILIFLEFGRKIRKCYLHAGAPEFRQFQRASSFCWCDVRQIWRPFLAISYSTTCACIADVNSGNVLWIVDRMAGGNIGLSKHFCAKGLITLIDILFWNNRRFNVIWGLCSFQRMYESTTLHLKHHKKRNRLLSCHAATWLIRTLLVKCIHTTFRGSILQNNLRLAIITFRWVVMHGGKKGNELSLVLLL